MNRGSQVISEIIEFCRAHEYTDVIFVHEHRGEPDNLVICHLPFGPTAFFELLNVLGQRTANILKHLFTVPKPETKRIITFANKSDYISFRYSLAFTIYSLIFII
ncbi:U3 small nucleolar ribonucleoprotein protein IMP4-like isoform X1 [Zingiber officinale]|uniref:U3 small nucleolar ribonucleoprotein protein IMP4-like isoform X1 n=1 Tax=Zingiber officinale TaxID=94328 RepID=UPI001C4DB135|nr:U3 small nucleolar ribonucleoprotein protein IMP4-like isoform X1 [Zingiber officinale]